MAVRVAGHPESFGMTESLTAGYPIFTNCCQFNQFVNNAGYNKV